MTTTPPPPKPSPLQKIISGDLGPLSQIQDSLGISLEDFADWMADPDNRNRINDLLSAQNAATESLLSSHRTSVGVTLLQIALTDHTELTTTAQRALETRRRACVDILKLRVFDPHKDDRLKPRPPKPPPPQPMMDPDDVRAVLEALYHERERQFQQSDPQSNNPKQRDDMPAQAGTERPTLIDRTSHAGSDGQDRVCGGDRCEEDPDQPHTVDSLTGHPTDPPTVQAIYNDLIKTYRPAPSPTASATTAASLEAFSIGDIPRTSPSTWQPLFPGHKPSSHPHDVLFTLCPHLNRFHALQNFTLHESATHKPPRRDRLSPDDSFHTVPSARATHAPNFLPRPPP